MRATRSERCQVAGERRLLAGRREESRDVRDERGRVGIDVGVGAEGRQHPPLERRIRGQRAVGCEVIERIVRRGEHLDAEPVEERTRAELRLLQCGLNAVVDAVGGHLVELLVDPEQRGQLVGQPVAARGAGEAMPILRQAAPDRPGVDGAARVESHLPEFQSSRMQHPCHVVIASDQQLCRVTERLVVEKKPWIDVTVRRDDRGGRDVVVQPAGDLARAWVRRQERITRRDAATYDRGRRGVIGHLPDPVSASPAASQRSRSANAAALGRRSRVNTPFLLPSTRITP